MWELKEKNTTPIIKCEILRGVYGNPKQNMCILCLTEKLWVINFIHDDNYLNEKSESINADILPNFYLRMSRDEFGSSSTLYECTVFSKIYFCDILSYIGISDLACSACQLIGLYISYRGPR